MTTSCTPLGEVSGIRVASFANRLANSENNNNLNSHTTLDVVNDEEFIRFPLDVSSSLPDVHTLHFSVHRSHFHMLDDIHYYVRDCFDRLLPWQQDEVASTLPILERMSTLFGFFDEDGNMVSATPPPTPTTSTTTTTNNRTTDDEDHPAADDETTTTVVGNDDPSRRVGQQQRLDGPQAAAEQEQVHHQDDNESENATAVHNDADVSGSDVAQQALVLPSPQDIINNVGNAVVASDNRLGRGGGDFVLTHDDLESDEPDDLWVESAGLLFDPETAVDLDVDLDDADEYLLVSEEQRPSKRQRQGGESSAFSSNNAPAVGTSH